MAAMLQELTFYVVKARSKKVPISASIRNIDTVITASYKFGYDI